MRFKLYDRKKHWETVEALFKKRSFPAPDPDFLPRVGMLIYHGEIAVCAGFLFRTDAGIATIGHLVSDPDVSDVPRQRAVDTLLDELVHIADVQGFRIVTCATNLPGLMARFTERGFTKTDENVAMFGRRL